MKSTHYGHDGLVEQIETALNQNLPSDRPLTPSELAPVDQFHTRGLAATAEIAAALGIAADMRVLDVGAGLGGPARFLAATYGCKVIGVDSSPYYVEAAELLTRRSNVGHRVSFRHADAMKLPFNDGSFDVVWMQHVAMNIADRAALYKEVRRVLVESGKLVLHDIVRARGAIAYPLPWAETEATSFLLSEEETKYVLKATGFGTITWQNDTEVANTWFNDVQMPPAAPGGFHLGMVAGPNFRTAGANLRRNLSAGALGIVVAIMMRA